MSIKHTAILENDAVQAALTKALKAQAEFQALCDELRDTLEPEEKLKRLLLAVQHTNTPAEIEAGMKLVAAWQGDGAEAAKGAALRQVANAAEKFKAALVPLVEAAEAAATVELERAREVERVFCEENCVDFGNGGPVVARAVGLKVSVEALRDSLRDSLRGQARPHRNTFANVLAWFSH